MVLERILVFPKPMSFYTLFEHRCAFYFNTLIFLEKYNRFIEDEALWVKHTFWS